MNKASKFLALFGVVALAAIAAAPSSLAAEAKPPVRIAVIEAMSGPSAIIGKWWSNHMRYAVDQVNAKGGVLGGREIEITYFDSKGSPQEGVIAFKAIVDQEFNVIFGTTGSNVALGLTDAILEAQRAQPGQGHPVPELRRTDARTHQ